MTTQTAWHEQPLRDREYDVVVKFRVTADNFPAAVERVRSIVDRDHFEHAIVPMYVPEQQEATIARCKNCSEDIELDDNGAGGTVWVHTFGSTVCHDNPPGSHEDGDTTTTAEPDTTREGG